MKQIWSIVLTILAILILAFIFIFFPPGLQEARVVSDVVVPTFSEVPIDFTHNYKEETHPFFGAALIDVDSDGKQEIFVGGAEGQDDVLFSYENGIFTNIIDSGLSRKASTYSAVSLDVDNDADIDLLITRVNGLFLYTNNDGTFTEQEIPLKLEENSIPLSVAVGDINKDGFVDLYISTFVDAAHFKSLTFNDPVHGKENILLLNNGDNTFTDITQKAGVNIDQNTFLAVFVDLNNDEWQDLVLSPNTDRVHIFENLGDGTFREIPQPTNYGAWMGLAVGDIDNDGDQDLFFSNMGNFVPSFFLQGDLQKDQELDTDWALLRNDGDFQFTSITKEKGLTNLEFAWGGVFEDFNLDGKLDLLVAENYLKWWAHKINPSPGTLFLQNENDFIPTTKLSGLENKYFGQSPLIVDLNDDGYPDVLYLNMDGPLRAFINDGGLHNYVKVVLPDNVASLGAKVTVQHQNKKLTKQVIPGTGLLTDHSPELFFGLGEEQGPLTVTIDFLSGETQTFEVTANQKLIVK